MGRGARPCFSRADAIRNVCTCDAKCALESSLTIILPLCAEWYPLACPLACPFAFPFAVLRSAAAAGLFSALTDAAQPIVLSLLLLVYVRERGCARAVSPTLIFPYACACVCAICFLVRRREEGWRLLCRCARDCAPMGEFRSRGTLCLVQKRLGGGIIFVAQSHSHLDPKTRETCQNDQKVHRCILDSLTLNSGFPPRFPTSFSIRSSGDTKYFSRRYTTTSKQNQRQSVGGAGFTQRIFHMIGQLDGSQIPGCCSYSTV